MNETPQTTAEVDSTTGNTASPDAYNGWVNRETWAVALHLSNDEILNDLATRLAHLDRWGDYIADYMTGIAEAVMVGDFETVPTVERMMLHDVGSLWRVDWKAVRDSFVDE